MMLSWTRCSQRLIDEAARRSLSMDSKNSNANSEKFTNIVLSSEEHWSWSITAPVFVCVVRSCSRVAIDRFR